MVNTYAGAFAADQCRHIGSLKSGAKHSAAQFRRPECGSDRLRETTTSVQYLTCGKSASERADDNAKTGALDEAILADIEAPGAVAVRELSEKLDSYSPVNFRLSQPDIDDLIAQLTPREPVDTKFAQDHVRTFAQAQRASMLDIEVETLPGIILGQAEHGYNRPWILVTNSGSLAGGTLVEIDRLLKILPTADIASVSWADHGEVILCDT
jgi:histidinol dehydrogenase